VSKLDMIGDEHVSILAGKKEAKWYTTARCYLEDIDKKSVETQLTLLPTCIWFPDKLPEFQTTNEDYNRIAGDRIRQRKKDEAAAKGEKIEDDHIDEKLKKDAKDPFLRPFKKMLKFLFANDKQQISVVNYTDEFKQG
jgi:hypothetical protein